MIEPRELVAVVVGAIALAAALVLLVRGVCAAMRRRVRAGLRVSPLLKKWLGFSYACTHERRLTIETPSTREIVSLDEVAEIRYRYHAVVGFVAWLEFVDWRGECVSVDDSVDGTGDYVLPWLEHQLSGFESSALARFVKEGDVEDACRIWTAA